LWTIHNGQKSQKKTLVAHAQAFHHKKHHPAEPNNAQPAVHDDDNAENECDYKCSVNCYWSEDSDYAPDSDLDWSDGDESVVEFKGEELEQNLTALRAEVRTNHPRCSVTGQTIQLCML
jgi:hypothetical protein